MKGFAAALLTTLIAIPAVAEDLKATAQSAVTIVTVADAYYFEMVNDRKTFEENLDIYRCYLAIVSPLERQIMAIRQPALKGYLELDEYAFQDGRREKIFNACRVKIDAVVLDLHRTATSEPNNFAAVDKKIKSLTSPLRHAVTARYPVLEPLIDAEHIHDTKGALERIRTAAEVAQQSR